MKGNCGSSNLVLALLFLKISLNSVCCRDQYYYQDEHNSERKLPDEFHADIDVHVRERRAVANASSVPHNKTDNHMYYTSKYSRDGQHLWMELVNRSDSVLVPFLSTGPLRSKNFQLKFKFPYYGHIVTNVTITSGGFLYVGYVQTTLIMKVMYIAPLMAYFNPGLNNDAVIHYFSNATQFTVQWTNVVLVNDAKGGPYTFQCTLFQDGRILFVYNSLAKRAADIPVSSGHHVKVGLSDAFYRWYRIWDTDRWIKLRVFYIYHKVVYPMVNIQSNGSLLLTPLPNCVSAMSCGECVNKTQTTSFNCAWCSKLKRCSDGFDRYRVEWFDKSCPKQAISKNDDCASPYNVYSGASSDTNVGYIIAIIVVCLVVIIIIAVGVWCFYAYTHPVTRSGLWLIELHHKPAQLFRRSDPGVSVGGTTGASRA